MKAGLLKYIIDVLRPVQVKDEYGSSTKQWIKVYSTRADFNKTGGNRTVENDETVINYQVNFKIRKYHDIRETDRISCMGKIYRIINIFPDIQMQQLDINAEQVNE